jgi:hypothetical protein
MQVYRFYLVQNLFNTLKRILLFIPLYSILFVSSCFSPQDENSKRKVLLKAVVNTLENEHYQPLSFNDNTSVKIFQSYLKTLDFQKRFFTLQDFSGFRKLENSIDDDILKESFGFYNLVNGTYRQRLNSVSRMYEGYLSKPIDLSASGAIETDPEKRQYPADTTVMLREWQDYFRYLVVSSVALEIEIQDKAKARKDTVIKVKTIEELEISAREKTLKNNKHCKSKNIASKLYMHKMYRQMCRRDTYMHYIYIENTHKYMVDRRKCFKLSMHIRIYTNDHAHMYM